MASSDLTAFSAWDDLDADKFADEAVHAPRLAGRIGLKGPERMAVRQDAIALIERARAGTKAKGFFDSFLEEFGLSNREGVALMCLAEALLRVPDADTIDDLIAEKLSDADWAEHLGRSESFLVNASAWGLMLTGRLIAADGAQARDFAKSVTRMAGRAGEPVIRAAIKQAMRFMGEHFVLGRSIEDAVARARKADLYDRHSYDMLGEAARTETDAERYAERYAHAIDHVAKVRGNADIVAAPGVSIKLSALHPRYLAVQELRVFEELYPRLLALCERAAQADVAVCLDAEEADRLVLSLKLLERLAREPSLADWRGLGLAVQAYQKRAAGVIARVSALGRELGRRFLVRLVKGAYWDTEVKLAQQNGFPDFPVWTTKKATDLNYLVCARALFEAGDAVYPQFATHNAHTVAAVKRLAGEREDYEFQRLHGMGEALYASARAVYGAELPVRVYAPVGPHKDLLPYLVRRLLENGANTSFVHAFLDADVPPEQAADDPFVNADALGPHAKVPRPTRLYGPDRRNAQGLDLTQASARDQLAQAVHALHAAGPIAAGPIVSGVVEARGGAPVASPSDLGRIVGSVREAEDADIDAALSAAGAAQPGWDRRGGTERARILRAMADALEADMAFFIALMAREGGKTLADGVAEVREAVDFCRYYAVQAERLFAAPERLPGPAGETNHLALAGRGVFLCISPWNFPLAIFTGQLAAALAAGNAVLAKPAEQTSLTAFEAVKRFHQAGVPQDVLHLLTGRGETVGARLVNDERVKGVAFTGGTDTAKAINRTLALREGAITPLIAETGGLNAMFVDTTALKEQVIDDVIVSGFGSAGQRCSALRILALPDKTADDMIEGVIGAMQTLSLGDPADPSVDVGPVIDGPSLQQLEAHMARMAVDARVLYRCDAGVLGRKGLGFGPALVEINGLDGLDREVFGPVVHVVGYEAGQAETLARALADKGYGLTLGVHSRLDSFAAKIRACVPVGNTYINRSMTGAVVGVQPFGGEGLSGTGPKAGGPYYLPRFAVERVVTVNVAAQGGDPELLNLD
ncbi:MAG: bifunctional proline dehydrogenase/L-glutamate gamma-semialdehyde dehydrogenase PutA [Maricaulaceae bacterium]